MRIIWSHAARRNLGEIVAYMADDTPGAAMRVDRLVVSATARLSDYPLMGKSGVIPGTRELLPHPSYRLIYSVSEEVVTILAVVHTSRQWPPVEDETS